MKTKIIAFFLMVFLSCSAFSVQLMSFQIQSLLRTTNSGLKINCGNYLSFEIQSFVQIAVSRKVPVEFYNLGHLQSFELENLVKMGAPYIIFSI